MAISLIIVVAAIMWAILVLSIFNEDKNLAFISGLLFAIFGIYVMINGINTINDWFTRSIAFVSIGLGIYIFIVAAYETLEDY